VAVVILAVCAAILISTAAAFVHPALGLFALGVACLAAAVVLQRVLEARR